MLFLAMLLWFVEEELADKAMLEKKPIEEEDVECRPDKVPYQCLHEDVNLSIIKKYFTKDA